MATYTFLSNVLSAQKTGSPPVTNASLSSVGVSFLSGASVTFATQSVGLVSLSTNDVGVLFNPTTFTVGTNALSTFALSNYPIVTVNIAGTVVNIPNLLTGSTFSIRKTSAGDYTTFPWLSTTTTVAASSITIDRNIVGPNALRLRLLGY